MRLLPISAINNRLEALATYLGINTDSETELSKIVSLSVDRNVHYYHHDNVVYAVSHQQDKLLKGGVVVSFNSSLWVVKNIDKEFFGAVKTFVVKRYKQKRLYGNSDAGKGDRIISDYVSELTKFGKSLIGRHESMTGETVTFSIADVFHEPILVP